MLRTPTLDKLREMKLQGMLRALEEQQGSSKYKGLSFDERLGLLVDAEHIERQNRRLRSRLRAAKLRLQASIEDLDYHCKRTGLDRSLMAKLATCQWIHEHRCITVHGPTGVGKSYVACALGHEACMKGMRVLYFRATRLFPDLELARADGRYARLMNTIARSDVLIIDDFGLCVLTDHERRDLLEILEDRHDRRSTIMTSQLPRKAWYDVVGDPTLADAVLDRIVHNAYEISMKGPSMRGRKPKGNGGTKKKR